MISHRLCTPRLAKLLGVFGVFVLLATPFMAHSLQPSPPVLLSGNTLVWDAPTQLANGAPIGNTLTGYRVFVSINGGDFVRYGEDLPPSQRSVSVGDAGRYAVMALWSNGDFASNTALSATYDAEWTYRASDCTTVVTPSQSKSQVQGILDDANPGDRICFRGNAGEYRFDWETSNIALRLRNGGTPGNPVYLSGYPGDPRAKLYGPMDLQRTVAEEASGDGRPEPERQVLVQVMDSNYVIENLEISRATRSNLLVSCSNVTVRNVISQDSYESSGIVIGSDAGTGNCTGTNENIQILGVESSFSRHGSGVWIRAQSATPIEAVDISGILLDRVLSYGNGRRREDNQLLRTVGPVAGDTQGGGNSDAFGSFKALNASDVNHPGNISSLRNLTLANSIGYSNGDNCFDGGGGGKITAMRNICMNRLDIQQSTSSGNGAAGLKNFQDSDYNAEIRYSGNIVFAANAPTVGTSGNTYELRVASPGGSSVLIAQDTATFNGNKGMNVSANIKGEGPGTHRLYGNVNDNEPGDRIVADDWDVKHNIDVGSGDERPGYRNRENYAPPRADQLCPNCSPMARLDSLRQLTLSNLMLPQNSSARDMVPFAPGDVHNVKFADDPVAPADPEGYEAFACFTNQDPGDSDACDAGAVQYQFMLPPSNLRIQ